MMDETSLCLVTKLVQCGYELMTEFKNTLMLELSVLKNRVFVKQAGSSRKSDIIDKWTVLQTYHHMTQQIPVLLASVASQTKLGIES